MSREVKFAVAYGMLIILLSSIPGNNFPDLKLFSQDKLIHLIEYGIFAFLVRRAVLSELNQFGPALVLTLIIGICYGGLDELYQGLIPGRLSSLYDWYADAAGVALGGLTSVIWTLRNAD
ncbi:VanZ family protein [Candidatus Neomarinimicrobiota bacterium]